MNPLQATAVVILIGVGIAMGGLAVYQTVQNVAACKSKGGVWSGDSCFKPEALVR